LTPVAWRIGGIDHPRWERLQAKEAEIARIADLLQTTRVDQTPLDRILRRPETAWEDLFPHCPRLAAVLPDVAEQVTIDAKYAGYVARQSLDVDRQHRLAKRRIPESFDFAGLIHLRTEAREKLARVRPASIDQAGRISGITPADLALLMVYLDGRP
jgi:tRNA uridine 5-carboxymethylaminomethyl modification enzyme